MPGEDVGWRWRERKWWRANGTEWCGGSGKAWDGTNERENRDKQCDILWYLSQVTDIRPDFLET